MKWEDDYAALGTVSGSVSVNCYQYHIFLTFSLGRSLFLIGFCLCHRMFFLGAELSVRGRIRGRASLYSVGKKSLASRGTSSWPFQKGLPSHSKFPASLEEVEIITELERPCG